MHKSIWFIIVATVCLTTTGCHKPSSPEVVVYTSVDQVFSEPIFQRFEQETGIRVKAAYDVESAKTVGLEKRLLAEKANPQADVFWNSEHLRTLRLAAAGVFTPHRSTAVQAIPENFRDPAGYWTAQGIRLRVLIVNNDLVAPHERPRRLDDLLDPRWQGKVAMAKPYFGTTSTHFAALYARKGVADYTRFVQGLRDNRVTLLAGNSNVRDAVVRGESAIGLTDTDDVDAALQRGDNVTLIYPDQDQDGAYALLYTVGLVAGGPHPDTGKKLVDYLLSPAVARQLLDARAMTLTALPEATAASPGTSLPQFWQTGPQGLLDALPPSAEIARRILGE